MAGHPPAKEVGFGLAQTAGWALLFCAKPRAADGEAYLKMGKFYLFCKCFLYKKQKV